METNMKLSGTGSLHTPTDLFNDTVTKTKISRHLMDINDVISEDDIRNIKVSIPEFDNIELPHNEGNVRPVRSWDVRDK